MFFTRRRNCHEFISKSLRTATECSCGSKMSMQQMLTKAFFFFASKNPTSHESNCCNIENIVENKSHACHRNTFNPINRTFEPSPIHVIACSELFFFSSHLRKIVKQTVHTHLRLFLVTNSEINIKFTVYFAMISIFRNMFRSQIGS